MQSFDVVIIGQGYAGLKVAGLAAARGLKVAAVEAMYPGGLIMGINELDPAPAGEPAGGADLASDIAMANMDLGVVGISGEVTALVRGEDGAWLIEADETLTAKNVVIASGARLRKLGVPGEAEFEGRGVSACADCDGPIFMGKEAVIVGGGDSAFQEALALTHYASQITIVMRGTAPRARSALVAAVAAHPAITLRSGTHVTAILGDEAVTAVELATADGAIDTLACAMVFAFVGLYPATEFLPDDIARDANGAVTVDSDLRAGAAGLWAVGAARSGYGGLFSDADADAETMIAALA